MTAEQRALNVYLAAPDSEAEAAWAVYLAEVAKTLERECDCDACQAEGERREATSHEYEQP